MAASDGSEFLYLHPHFDFQITSGNKIKNIPMPINVRNDIPFAKNISALIGFGTSANITLHSVSGFVYT